MFQGEFELCKTVLWQKCCYAAKVGIATPDAQVLNWSYSLSRRWNSKLVFQCVHWHLRTQSNLSVLLNVSTIPDFFLSQTVFTPIQHLLHIQLVSRHYKIILGLSPNWDLPFISIIAFSFPLTSRQVKLL